MNIFNTTKLAIFKTIILVFCFFIKLASNAQLIQNKSIEIDLPISSERPDYVVIPLKDGGFLLQERSDQSYGKKGNIWFTKKYSNNMELLWSTEIPISLELEYSLECLTKNALYQNFRQSNSTKVHLLRIDLEKGDADWIEGDLIGIQDFFQLKIVDNTAYFSGKFQGRAVVMGLSFFDRKVKALNGLYANHMEVVEIEVDEEKEQLHIYSKNRYRGACQLQLRIYDKEGTPVATTILENETKKLPFNGRMNNLNNNEALMIGNYSRYCESFSQGIYVKKIEDNVTVKSKFLDFSEFNNFFNYLNPKRQKKVKEKLNKRKQAGKDIKFNYSMLVHKLYEYNDQHVMVAEIYYTEVRNGTNSPFYAYGHFYPYNYKFTHTIICGFDKNGNKLWDNCFPMKALTSVYLNEQVQLTQVENKFILAYPEDGKIKTQVIEADKTIREKEEFEVVAKKNSFWNEDTNGGLSAWYDQNFLYWGYKTMPDAGNANGRKVFFIDKLTYKL